MGGGLYKYLTWASIFVLGFSNVSWAMQYEVAVRQALEGRWTYRTTCADMSNVCHLFMGVLPQVAPYEADDLELDIGMVFRDGKVHIQFKSGWDYFVAKAKEGGNYTSLVIRDIPVETERIKLYVPHPQAKYDPRHSLALRPPVGLLAELEMTIKPQKNLPAR